MKITCEDRRMISDEYIEPCEPCLWNKEMRRLLMETQADALKEIPEKYAQERFGISREEMDFQHFEEMCEKGEHSFPAYVILQTIEMFGILDSEPSYGSPCETPQEEEE